MGRRTKATKVEEVTENIEVEVPLDLQIDRVIMALRLCRSTMEDAATDEDAKSGEEELCIPNCISCPYLDEELGLDSCLLLYEDAAQLMEKWKESIKPVVPRLNHNAGLANCGECGHYLLDKFKYCPKCGKKVKRG